MSLIEGEDYYINDESNVVFTASYHLKRGYCCSNGCLHCPYNYENVPEPKKSKLLDERKKRQQQDQGDTPIR